jgi:hypothetical protein
MSLRRRQLVFVLLKEKTMSNVRKKPQAGAGRALLNRLETLERELRNDGRRDDLVGIAQEALSLVEDLAERAAVILAHLGVTDDNTLPASQVLLDLRALARTRDGR